MLYGEYLLYVHNVQRHHIIIIMYICGQNFDNVSLFGTLLAGGSENRNANARDV